MSNPLRDLVISVDNFATIKKTLQPLIKKLVREIHAAFPRIELDDYLQEADICLWKCIKNFDASKGVYFQMYASRAIYQALYMHVRAYLPGYYEITASKKWKRIHINVGSLDAILAPKKN